MRLPLFAAALLAAAAPLPALAQDAEDAPMASVIEVLEDPAMQEQVALTAAALMGVMMELPVGTLAESVSEAAGEEAPPIDPDARVRDLVGPDAGEVTQTLTERLPEMMTAMAGMAGLLEEMLPQLREVAERLPDMLPEDLTPDVPDSDAADD